MNRLTLREALPTRAGGLAEDTLNLLTTLRGLGVRIALDDFGTGYSSLSYLQGLPVDLLKLDRSFVRAVTESPRDAAITAAVASMAPAFGVTAVAEGIEHPEQRRVLEDQGYSLMQGYRFGGPMAEAELLGQLVAQPAGSRSCPGA